MKLVYLVRHAKSSWDHPGLSDFDRPLSERGLKNAPFMARLMTVQEQKADMIITSTARRAMETANFFANAFELNPHNFVTRPDLYETDADHYFEVIRGIPDWIEVAYLFGHNPTLTMVANTFPTVTLDNMPTCGVLKIESFAENWQQFNTENSFVRHVYYPKQYFQV